jgi:cytochrome c
MKRIVVTVVSGLAAALFQVSGYAADPRGMEEAKEHGCLKCHDVDKKKAGPSFKESSAKYKGKKVEDAMAEMKGKAVHKSPLQKTSDGSLKEIMQWIQSL